MKMLGLVVASAGTVLIASPCLSATAAVCVADKLDASLHVIDSMKADKLDLKKRRLVTQLFTGEDEQFPSLGKQLGRNGWLAASYGPGRLLASATVTADREWATKTVTLMCNIAAENRVEWDGWDIDVAAEHIQAKAN